MKILFICSSLEPGKDGVGDYCRKLAAAFIKAGHPSAIISVNDKHFFEEITEAFHFEEGVKVPVLRCPKYFSWKYRFNFIKKFITAYTPDWISIHYVPYGFQKKGLPFYLPKALASLTQKCKTHLMFHEIWAGLNPSSSFMHKVYGYLQKKIAGSLVRKLQPKFITTTNELYCRALKEENIQASCIPLFSNISIHEKDNLFLSSLQQKYRIDVEDNNYCKIGIFGTAYPEAHLSSVIPKYLKEQQNSKKVVIIFFGRNNQPTETEKLKIVLQQTVNFIELGELSEQHVSNTMGILDEAVLCTPVEYIGKSGVYAALKFHSVTILTLSSIPLARYTKEVNAYNSYLSQRLAYKWSVTHISEKYLLLFGKVAN